jgi:hypothetical protein
MKQYQQDICKDCIHHKGDGWNMVCGLSGEKPHFELRCHDFVASESVVKKYLDNRNAMQDKLVDEARGWISLAVVSAIAVLVICFVPGIVAHPIVFALLAVLLAVLGVYMFVHSRDKSHAIDVEKAKWLAANSKPQVAKHKQSDKQPQDDTVTIDRAMRLLKDLGYAPEHLKSDDGTRWVGFVYGETKMNLTITGPLVQVGCAYGWGDMEQTPENIYNFLHASNYVMRSQRFVQITGDERCCNFTISGFAPTMNDLRDTLPMYLSAIGEAIMLHRQAFGSYAHEAEKHRQQEVNNNRPVN